MKTKTQTAWALKSLVLMIFATALFSFSTFPGGDSYTIYLNDKLLIQHYVYKGENLKPLELAGVGANDIFKVHYSHCGKMGIARALAIKDNSNQSLKTWKFENSDDGEAGAMRVKAAEVLSLQKAKPQRKLSLFYLSEQLPHGVTLASFSLNSDVKASIK